MAHDHLYASGYTSSPGDPGVHLYDISRGGDDVTAIAEASGAMSPSYCTPRGKRLYASCEMQDRGGLAAYVLDEHGVPTLDSAFAFEGAAGTCFALVHADGDMLHAANYNSGSVCECPLDADGGFAPPVRLIQHSGHGVERDAGDLNHGRQSSPHVHTLSIVPGTSLLAAVDLGLDAIVLYQTDAAGRIVDAAGELVVSEWPGAQSHVSEVFAPGGHTRVHLKRHVTLEDQGDFGTYHAQPVGFGHVLEAEFPVRPAGIVEAPLLAGPRIVAYHPQLPIVALVCELACALVLFRMHDDGRRWEVLGSYDLLEGMEATPRSSEPPLAAHCAFARDGRFLYVSTRGTDVISTFALDGAGLPVGRTDVSCGGATPRHFALNHDDSLLAVANQTGDTVAVFGRDAVSGELREAATVPCAHPSSIVWK